MLSDLFDSLLTLVLLCVELNLSSQIRPDPAGFGKVKSDTSLKMTDISFITDTIYRKNRY